MGKVLLTFKEESISKAIKENRETIQELFGIPVEARIFRDVEKIPNQTDSWGIVFEHNDIPKGPDQIKYFGDGDDLK